jgi:TolA-binding protein
MLSARNAKTAKKKKRKTCDAKSSSQAMNTTPICDSLPMDHLQYQAMLETQMAEQRRDMNRQLEEMRKLLKGQQSQSECLVTTLVDVD